MAMTVITTSISIRVKPFVIGELLFILSIDKAKGNDSRSRMAEN
jgi:hypothetical protein